MINVVDVTQHYGIRPIIRDANLTVRSGEMVAVMGPNGMGKSTLLKTMAGILSPQKGHVEINGLVRRQSPEAELSIRRQVGYLPDHPWLPKRSSGRDFLLAVGRVYQVAEERLFDHIDRLFGLFDLRDKGDSSIMTYSNGQRKKLAVCAVLVAEPPVLLLDEPFTGGLDPSGIFALKRVLHSLAERDDVTIVMATQLPEMAEELAHKVAVLREGKIIAFDTLKGLQELTDCSGSLQEILEHLIHPQTLKNVEAYFERGK